MTEEELEIKFKELVATYNEEISFMHVDSCVSLKGIRVRMDRLENMTENLLMLLEDIYETQAAINELWRDKAIASHDLEV